MVDGDDLGTYESDPETNKKIKKHFAKQNASNLLEDRLLCLGFDMRDKVRRALSISHVNPQEYWSSMPYFKLDLVDAVAERIGDSDFSRVLYSAVNKNVLKRVYYGIISTGNLPLEFKKALTNWENVYFFRGRWAERNPDLALPLKRIVSTHLKLGLDKLHEDHFVRKARREYSSQRKFPESDKIRRDFQRIVLRK